VLRFYNSPFASRKVPNIGNGDWFHFYFQVRFPALTDSGLIMLTEIIKLLKERGPMSLAELAHHFQTEVPAMEGMLEMLARKNRIRRLANKCSGCKGCAEVKPEDAAVFQYLENEQ
jgi:ferredoxin